MYNLVFAPAFAADLDEMFAYITSNLSAPKAAMDLLGEIDRSILLLKETPLMYPLCPEPLDIMNYRIMTVKNYIIIYNVDEAVKCVDLLRCFFGKSNYLRFFGL